MVKGQELCSLEVYKSTTASGNLVSAHRGHVKPYLVASFSGLFKFGNQNNSLHNQLWQDIHMDNCRLN